MSRLYTYIMQADTGLAPNPFGGVCTLAVCTPNHQGSKVCIGDWIAGFQSKSHGYRLVYAMVVDECLRLDAYFHDPRFASKKPDLEGSWQERCGDNFYNQREDGSWQQHPNRYHMSDNLKKRDTRHPRVFIGRRFWYLGHNAVALPEVFRPLAGGRGARVNHPADLVEGFMSWVEQCFENGIHGDPRDAEFEPPNLSQIKSGCRSSDPRPTPARQARPPSC